MTRLTGLKTFAVLFLFALLARVDTLALSDIGWDESLYFLMAKSMIQHHAPYTIIWDHKPPGIYAIYYLALELFGQSAFSVRIFASLAMALTSLFVIRIHNRLRNTRSWTDIVPGLLVLLAFRQYGSAGANNEVFFLPATTGAILLFLTGLDPARSMVRRRLALFFAGAAAAAAFWIKFNTVVEIAIAGIGIALWCTSAEETNPVKIWVERLSLSACGFIAVSLLVVLPFALTGNLALLFDSTIAANIRHVGQRMPALETLNYALQIVGGSIVLWALVLAGLAFHLRKLRKDQDRILAHPYWFSLAWLLGAAISAFAPGQPYPHYALEMCVPLTLVAWLLFEDVFLANMPDRRATQAGIVFLLVGTIGVTLVEIPLALGRELTSLFKRGSLESVDTALAVSNYIRKHAGNSKISLFVVDGSLMLYALTNVEPPTKYAFSPFLLDPHFQRVAGLDGKAEVTRILRSEPEFVVRSTNPLQEAIAMRAYVDGLLVDRYVVDTVIHNTEILRRRLDKDRAP
jgi:4-amino-4-deoxy-L-arabinose transferase-like glycosyltransferase